MFRVLFGVADTPFRLLGAGRDGRAGEVGPLNMFVSVDSVATLDSDRSPRGFQSVPRSQWLVVHVVSSDRLDERKE